MFKSVQVFGDNVLVGEVPKDGGDSSKFLYSVEDSSFTGILLLVGEDARDQLEKFINRKVYFGKDFITVNIQGRNIKVMSLKNVKAADKDSVAKG